MEILLESQKKVALKFSLDNGDPVDKIVLSFESVEKSFGFNRKLWQESIYFALVPKMLIFNFSAKFHKVLLFG